MIKGEQKVSKGKAEEDIKQPIKRLGLSMRSLPKTKIHTKYKVLLSGKLQYPVVQLLLYNVSSTTGANKKVVPVHTIKTYRENIGIATLVHRLSAR